MRARIFDDRAAAEAAQAAAASPLVVHTEGPGPGQYQIPSPGHAAERLRARGITTHDHPELVVHPTGRRFALLDPAGPDELSTTEWFPLPRPIEAP